jgi:hypothetical protein
MQCLYGILWRIDVPDLWDKPTDAPPQSQLNPLTNPVLERNLVRWAQVYFSSPPGKREQAVNKLLEEIKREASEGRAGEYQEVVCSVCQHKNAAGHRFCGGCGEALTPVPSDFSESSAPAETNVQWLRDRAFRSLEVSDAPKQRGRLYLVGALAIALAGFACLRWAPGFQPKVAMPASTSALHTSEPAPQLTAESYPQEEIQRPAETILPDAKTQEPHDRRSPMAGVETAAQKSPLLDSAPPHRAGDDGESGAPDLRLAQRYLGGSMGARDSSEAATLLWKAVRKQNTTAAVLLSDLYARGDGVPRSCDQARLLLLAAAKRGSSRATEQLRRLEIHGCE